MTSELIEVPLSACYASVSVELSSAVAATESPFSLTEDNFFWGGQRWEIDFVMPPFKGRNMAADWLAFGVKCKGSYNTFLIGDPMGKNPRGAGGTIVVDGSGQTGNQLEISSSPNITGLLKKADYFQLGTGAGAKLYMVTNDLNTDGSGKGIVEFEPQLRVSPGDSQQLIVVNPRGVFKVINNSWSWSVTPGGIYRMSFRAREVLR